jgi:hypothetical protein
MKQQLQKAYHKIVPEKMRWWLTRQQINQSYAELRKNAVAYLAQAADPEFRTAGDFLAKRGMEMFPYAYIDKYNAGDIQVFSDDSCGLYYVLFQGKRLYARRGMLPSAVKRMVNSLLSEQDPDSPHCYVTAGFDVKQGGVLYDLGAAEGIFALMCIEKVSKAYLFEVEESWIEALNKTFEPWKEKVEIVNKFVGDQDSADGRFVTLNTFAKDHPLPDFIKADIEGAEPGMLLGASSILSQDRPLRLAVCTYHNEQDGPRIDEILKKDHFQTTYTKGYVFFFYQRPLIGAPYLRKALIRGEKTAG